MEDRGLRGQKVLSIVLCICQTLFLNCPFAYSLLFHTQPASVVEKQGGAVHLQCLVHPASAKVTWFFQGRALEQDLPPGVVVHPDKISLPSLQPQNTGTYQCVAHSGTGSITSQWARVTIADIMEFGQTHRRSLVEREGNTAVIECQLPRSNPPALPRYRIRGKWLEESTDEYLILPSGNLHIVSVSPEHQGMYKCGAYNPVTREVKVEPYGTKLLVKNADGPSPVGIVYPVNSVNLTVEQSMSLVLECVVSGNPSPVVKWLKDGQELPLAPRLRLLHSNLVLSDVQISDGGNYTCFVQGEDGAMASANYTVDVLGPPVIVKGLSDQLVKPGSSVQFSCLTSGNPAPNITWLFNSSPVFSSPRLQISNSILHIFSVTAQDQGMYQCVLDNRIGSAQSAARLSIQLEPQYSSTTAATVDTQPTVHPIQSDGEGLFLPSEDARSDANGSFTETASDKPTPEAPIIISPPQTHRPNEYDLEWRPGRDWGRAINAYFVKYRKVDEMGNVVGSWHTVRVPGSERSLPLSDLEPSSLYEVLMVARSSAGEGQPAMLTFRTGKEKNPPSSKNPSKAPFVSLPEKAPEEKTTNTHYGVVIHDRVPEAPDRPTISTASENSVYVTWIPRANGGSPITAFRVEYRKGRNTAWIIADDNISPLKLSVEVRNLEAGFTYRFRVIAMNTYGESPHSATSRPYQIETINPPGSNRPVAGPHISSTDAVSDTQIMVRWTYTTSSNNNTPIQGFYIYYRPTDSDNDGDYKKDVVDGIKRWHMIGHLQPETSYDIKMQCYNEAGESDYSNVMICETKARQPHGVPSQWPITPPVVYPPNSGSSAGGVLYLIVGCILGVMVLILIVFIIMCLWRNRQQHTMHKYNPPGYLYQPAEMNGHILEYTTLSGSSQLNGNMHGSYENNGSVMPQSCHHLHHKLPNGLTLLNGSGPHYSMGHSHTHDIPLPHSTMDFDHAHPHHMHSREGLYTSVPQTDSSDCMNCQNFCNNNRCYTKANGNFTGGLKHHLVPCQLDGLEMLPLNHGSLLCHGNDCPEPQGNCERADGIREQMQVNSDSTSSRSSQSGTEQEVQGIIFSKDSAQCVNSDEPLMCLERLDLSDLDCREKTIWISTSSLNGDLIHPTAQEI
ncbi:cell adhesion molecule-related/down-regulated by oncogenes isoform X1 [Clarias gariepinus]|uniref:cell adhesion molecule-related/down-regulated by oncogenes isoform X1 n=1 Tax=Clarias gariepinus TaxID=13013 RepID=UPI00234C0D94|nr:cell adhesion molecule-related/down-regulated by oncogenes isoform X1 [Clarias gariepinus]XP_053356548.1 cell adhesion molecule-related/down-regulated by oncogenes isoform X1 [Clarias gariepinus]